MISINNPHLNVSLSTHIQNHLQQLLLWLYRCSFNYLMWVRARTNKILVKLFSKRCLSQNSMWYLMCILLRAGSGFNTQCAAARLASSIWWLFSLVLIAQYTANFAAVLTVERKSMPFNVRKFSNLVFSNNANLGVTKSRRCFIHCLNLKTAATHPCSDPARCHWFYKDRSVLDDSGARTSHEWETARNILTNRGNALHFRPEIWEMARYGPARWTRFLQCDSSLYCY